VIEAHEFREPGIAGLPGPVIVDVVVDPTEIPAMPHIKLDNVWKFGIGKMRELVN
jgi:hypothetical protein